MAEFVDMAKISLPDRLCNELAKSLAKRLPDLFASSPALQDEFDEWYKGRHGITYKEFLLQTGQESPYQLHQRRVSASA